MTRPTRRSVEKALERVTDDAAPGSVGEWVRETLASGWDVTFRDDEAPDRRADSGEVCVLETSDGATVWVPVGMVPDRIDIDDARGFY